MTEMSREQWAMAYAEVNSDQDFSDAEMGRAYQDGLKRYDEGGTSCHFCGKGWLLTFADTELGPSCLACVADRHARILSDLGPECGTFAAPVCLVDLTPEDSPVKRICGRLLPCEEHR